MRQSEENVRFELSLGAQLSRYTGLLLKVTLVNWYNACIVGVKWRRQRLLD